MESFANLFSGEQRRGIVQDVVADVVILVQQSIAHWDHGD